MKRTLLPAVHATFVWLILAGCLPALAAPPAAAPPPAPSVVPAAPFEFAPMPLPLPAAGATQHKQVAALLRGFEPVQRAEVLFSGEAGKDLALQAVIKCRPGRTLDAAALQALAQLICAGVPGLAPERLNVATSDGRLLIVGGKVQPLALAPSPLSGSRGLLLLLALAVGAGAWALWRLRGGTPRADEETLEALIALQPRPLARLLRQERPEMAGLILSAVEPRLARRLQQALRAERIAAKLPPHQPEPAAAQAAARLLYERLGVEKLS